MVLVEVVGVVTVVVEVPVAIVSPRTRLKAKITPTTRETKMYFLYFRNHSAHGEEEDVRPSLENKETVDSHLRYSAPLNMMEVEVSTLGFSAQN